MDEENHFIRKQAGKVPCRPSDTIELREKTFKSLLEQGTHKLTGDIQGSITGRGKQVLRGEYLVMSCPAPETEVKTYIHT